MSCKCCLRNCKSRESGFCGVGDKIIVARIAPHFWEEPVISGERGSGTVFFSGCSLRCVFCQNEEISRALLGKEIHAEELDMHIKSLIKKGVHNINFVTPSHYSLFLADFLEKHKYPVPIVYNCSGYESEEALEALRGKVQIFLPDFKYSDNSLAKKYSSVTDYTSVAKRAIKKMYELVGDAEYDSEGMLKKGVLVRHLVLPENTENSLGAVDFFEQFSKNKKVLFSLMSQYTPCGDLSKFPELQNKVSQEEYNKILNYMFLLGLDGFCQEPESADKIYIPPFSADLEV